MTATRYAPRRSATLDVALARPCPVHDAGVGVYCWDFPTSGVRGLCAARYGVAVTELGVSLYRESLVWQPVGAPDLARSDPGTKLHREHPNRHHLREARA